MAGAWLAATVRTVRRPITLVLALALLAVPAVAQTAVVYAPRPQPLVPAPLSPVAQPTIPNPNMAVVSPASPVPFVPPVQPSPFEAQPPSISPAANPAINPDVFSTPVVGNEAQIPPAVPTTTSPLPLAVPPGANVPSSLEAAPGAVVEAAAANANAQQQFASENVTVLAAQLSQATTPAGAQELARRSAEFFSNGAGVTTVPTIGPGAAYFDNAASVLTVPSSVVPFEAPTAPPTAPAQAPPLPTVMPAQAPAPVYVIVQPAAVAAPSQAAEAPPAPVEAAQQAVVQPTVAPAAPAPTATAPAPAEVPSEGPPRPTFPRSLPELTFPNPTPPMATVPESRHEPSGVSVALVLGGVGLGAAMVLLGKRVRRLA